MNDLVLRYAEAIDARRLEAVPHGLHRGLLPDLREPWGPLEGLDVLYRLRHITFHAPLEHLRHATTNFRIGAYDGETARGRCRRSRR